MKKKKHNKIVKDYDKQKEKHLEKLATKMLENDEKLSKLLEQSFFYYKKEASTSKEIFSNTLSLIHDYALDKIKNSTMDEEKKYDVINLCRSYFKNFTSQVETFCDLMDFFNKNNNLLEPKEISIIILGYATGIFKKQYTN